MDIDEVKFWGKVNKKGPYSKKLRSRCWEWTGSRFPGGYGKLWCKKDIQSHRCSWILHYSSIPKGACVLHKCDNPGCVNPKHLWLGTQKDNAQDMLQKGRGNKASGKRHGRYTKPERTARGNRHGWVVHPESLPRGDNHYLKKRPEESLKGERNGRAKLTEIDVLEIRRLQQLSRRRLPGGVSQTKLAVRYGVCTTTIESIVARRLWKHI